MSANIKQSVVIQNQQCDALEVSGGTGVEKVIERNVCLTAELSMDKNIVPSSPTLTQEELSESGYSAIIVSKYSRRACEELGRCKMWYPVQPLILFHHKWADMAYLLPGTLFRTLRLRVYTDQNWLQTDYWEGPPILLRSQVTNKVTKNQSLLQPRPLRKTQD